MQQEVIKLYDEQNLMKDLLEDTFNLIKRAKKLDAVKKLIEIHDILSLNASILAKFQEAQLTFDEIWLDAPTLRHLNHLRCELLVYYHTEFISYAEIEAYNLAFCHFLNLILLRLKNGFDFEISIQGTALKIN